MDQMIRAMDQADVPAKIINLTHPEIASVRTIAEKLGRLMGKKPRFKGRPKGISLLADASLAKKLFGQPRTTLDEGLRLLAESVMKREHPLDHPTKWEHRKGF